MRTIAICLIIAALVISGCLSPDASVCGTYSYKGSTLTLQEDSTYLYTSAKYGITEKGMYKQYGSDIQATNILGITIIMRIDDRGLIDKDGDLWSRV